MILSNGQIHFIQFKQIFTDKGAVFAECEKLLYKRPYNYHGAEGIQRSHLQHHRGMGKAKMKCED